MSKKNKKTLMCECVSEDAEGRSSAVPLMVSARELKCIPLTASERVCATNYSRPPHSQGKEKNKKNARMRLFQEGSEPPPDKGSGVRLKLEPPS